MLGAWVVFFAPAAAQAEPRLVEGALENGLRYQILEAPQATGISLRLRIEAGSQDEAEDEHGAAHFVEHMAFRATRSRPQGDIDAVMAQRGLTSGRDHNAFTSERETTYHLDLPGADGADLDLALVWLRDVGDGLLFRPEEVDIERGVVQAERRGMQIPETPTIEAEWAFQFVGEGDRDRSPAGTEESLRSLDASKLAAFHRRAYRPDRSLLIVTGPVEAAAVAPLIRERFSGWRPAGDAAERAPRRDLARLSAPEVRLLPATRVPRRSLVCKSSAALPEAPETADLAEFVWAEILAARLTSAAARDADVHSLDVIGPLRFDRAASLCVSAAHADGAAGRAVALIRTAMRALSEQGPSQGEIDHVLAVERAALRGLQDTEAARSSFAWADELLRLASLERPYRTANEDMRRLNRFAETLSPEAVRAAFLQAWPPDAPPRISVEDAKAPKASEILAAWTAAGASELPPAPQAPVIAFGDASPVALGALGQVVGREVLEHGVLRLRFGNGVVVNHMRTSFAPGEVTVVVRIGDGRRGLPPDQFLPATLGAALLVDGGLEGHPAAELARSYATRDWRFAAELEDEALVFSSEMLAGNLKFGLAMMAAYVKAPAFDPSLAAPLADYADREAQLGATDPSYVARNALMKALWPDYFAVTLAPEAAAALSVADLRRALSADLALGRIDVAVVGDASEEAVREAVAATFGALPPRRRPPPPTRAQHLVAPEARPKAPIEVVHEGPTSRAAAQIRWPLYGADGDDLETLATLAVVSRILEIAVMEETRQRRGMTYAPLVGVEMRPRSDQGVLLVVVESAAADLDAVVAAVRDAARRLAAEEITPQMFEAARRPIQADREVRLSDNGSWALTLSQSSREPTALSDSLAIGATLDALTVAQVQAAAVRWLTPEPIVALARPAAGLKEAGEAP